MTFEFRNTQNNGRASWPRVAALGVCTLAGLCSGELAKKVTISNMPSPLERGTDPNTGLSNFLILDETLFSVGLDMKVSSDSENIGKVVERNLRMRKTFELLDSTGNVKASASEEILSIGVKIDIHDEKGTKIGSVQENVIENFFSAKSHYTINDANGNEIAHSEKLDFGGTEIEIKDPNGKLLVVMRRPVINLWLDSWIVSILSPIDPRLIIFIPSFKTSADKKREAEQAEQEEQEEQDNK